VNAVRQVLGAAIRWGYIERNPMVLAGRNRQPSMRPARVYMDAELDAIAAEMDPQYQPMPQFVAATGLRPEEWQPLERRDIDRKAGVLNVQRTVASGEVVELRKTSRSRRQVPLSARALDALDALPPRLDSPLLFPARHRAGLLVSSTFYHEDWAPAIEAAGVQKPARIYDLRHTFASNSLASYVSTFELARIMGTSVQMIDQRYGALLQGAATSLAARLSAGEAARKAAREEEAL
jgi:integrase